MGQAVKVAVVRDDDRRSAVARALALIADDLVGAGRGRGPDQAEPRQPQISTPFDPRRHPRRGPRRRLLGRRGPGHRRRRGERRLGRVRPVRVPPRSRGAARPVLRHQPRRDRVGAAEADRRRRPAARSPGSRGRSRGSPCRVSLALAKTHVTSMVTLSLKNMLSSIHPDDRVMMHGHAGGGNGYAGWRRLAVEFLKQDNLAVNALTRADGARPERPERLAVVAVPGRPVPRPDQGRTRLPAHRRGDEPEPRRAGPQDQAARLGRRRLHRRCTAKGPRHGTPIRLGTVIAGTDPVAVDAVAAAVMGFDPATDRLPRLRRGGRARRGRPRPDHRRRATRSPRPPPVRAPLQPRRPAPLAPAARPAVRGPHFACRDRARGGRGPMTNHGPRRRRGRRVVDARPDRPTCLSRFADEVRGRGEVVLVDGSRGDAGAELSRRPGDPRAGRRRSRRNSGATGCARPTRRWSRSRRPRWSRLPAGSTPCSRG